MKKPIQNIFLSEWNKELKYLDEQHLTRTLKLNCGRDFSSNDYLSLSSHPGIRKSLIQALKNNIPLSAGASRLIRGHTPFHKETEKLFAKWASRPSALFFSSGYMANMGLLSALCNTKNDIALFSDQLNHASLIDACRFTRKPCHIYPHKNTDRLSHLLKKEKTKKKIIITESIFSMDGDLAPLKELSRLALKHQALLIVDEAHATGCYGPQGTGLCHSLKQKDHIITVHPCGKALSTAGAFVTGPAPLIKYLINKCRNFIYTTAPTPLSLFHIQCVLNTLQKEPNRRKLLKKKADFFRSKVSLFADIGDSESAIFPIITGSARSALALQKALQKKGYDIRAIRYPTVPKGTERLRICVHYNHTYKELEQLAQLLKKQI